MLHTTNPIIKYKTDLLYLAEELSNLSKPVKSWMFHVIHFIFIARWPMIQPSGLL